MPVAFNQARINVKPFGIDYLSAFGSLDLISYGLNFAVLDKYVTLERFGADRIENQAAAYELCHVRLLSLSFL